MYKQLWNKYASGWLKTLLFSCSYSHHCPAFQLGPAWPLDFRSSENPPPHPTPAQALVSWWPARSLQLIWRSDPLTQIAKFTGPIWSPPGSCRPQMVPMLPPLTRPQMVPMLPPVTRKMFPFDDVTMPRTGSMQDEFWQYKYNCGPVCHFDIFTFMLSTG